MGPECQKFHKRVATLLSDKKGETYANVMQHLRTKVRFALLKTILIAVRGVRGKSQRQRTMPLADVSFNLIPEYPCYDSLL